MGYTAGESYSGYPVSPVKPPAPSGMTGPLYAQPPSQAQQAPAPLKPVPPSGMTGPLYPTPPGSMGGASSASQPAPNYQPAPTANNPNPAPQYVAPPQAVRQSPALTVTQSSTPLTLQSANSLPAGMTTPPNVQQSTNQPTIAPAQANVQQPTITQYQPKGLYAIEQRLQAYEAQGNAPQAIAARAGLTITSGIFTVGEATEETATAIARNPLSLLDVKGGVKGTAQTLSLAAEDVRTYQSGGSALKLGSALGKTAFLAGTAYATGKATSGLASAFNKLAFTSTTEGTLVVRASPETIGLEMPGGRTVTAITATVEYPTVVKTGRLTPLSEAVMLPEHLRFGPLGETRSTPAPGWVTANLIEQGAGKNVKLVAQTAFGNKLVSGAGGVAEALPTFEVTRGVAATQSFEITPTASVNTRPPAFQTLSGGYLQAGGKTLRYFTGSDTLVVKNVPGEPLSVSEFGVTPERPAYQAFEYGGRTRLTQVGSNKGPEIAFSGRVELPLKFSRVASVSRVTPTAGEPQGLKFTSLAESTKKTPFKTTFDVSSPAAKAAIKAGNTVSLTKSSSAGLARALSVAPVIDVTEVGELELFVPVARAPRTPAIGASFVLGAGQAPGTASRLLPKTASGMTIKPSSGLTLVRATTITPRAAVVSEPMRAVAYRSAASSALRVTPASMTATTLRTAMATTPAYARVPATSLRTPGLVVPEQRYPLYSRGGLNLVGPKQSRKPRRRAEAKPFYFKQGIATDYLSRFISQMQTGRATKPEATPANLARFNRLLKTGRQIFPTQQIYSGQAKIPSFKVLGKGKLLFRKRD